ncbi:MAG: ABC transporter substrate-binding protein [Bacteroidota bacterium]
MIQRSISHTLLLISCFVFVLLQSCKTDPKSDAGASVSDEPLTVVSHLNAEPDMLNPIISTSGYTRSVTNHIFQNLVHYDTKTLELAPMLAKAIPQSEVIEAGEYKGKIRRTYEIHDEAIWTDGKPVTGHDVAFSLKAVMNPKVPAPQYRSFSNEYKDIIIDEANPKKFSIISTDYFLGDYVFTDIPVFPSHIFDPKGLMEKYTVKQLSDAKTAAELAASDEQLQEFATQFTSEEFMRDKKYVQGSGAYELVEWRPGQQIILKKKENWWGDQLADEYNLLTARAEEIIFRPIIDPTTAVTELKGEGVDVMNMIAPQQYEALKNSEQGKKLLNFYEPDVLQIYYIGINTNNPKLSDKRVRRALAHLVDQERIISNIMSGYGRPIVSPIHPSRSYYNDDLPAIEYSPEKAITLLKEAGWEDTNGNGVVDKVIDGELTELRIDYLASRGGRGGMIGKLIAEGAKLAGVDLRLDEKDLNLVRQKMSSRDYEMTTGAWGQDPSLYDPYQNWHTDNDVPSGGNKFGFGNDASDTVIEKIRSRVTPEERTQLYKDLQQIIYDEQPCIFLLAPKGRMAVNKKFDYEPSIRKPNIFENEFKWSNNKIVSD